MILFQYGGTRLHSPLACASIGPSVTSRIWVLSGWALIGESRAYADTPSVEGRRGEGGREGGRGGRERRKGEKRRKEGRGGGRN